MKKIALILCFIISIASVLFAQKYQKDYKVTVDILTEQKVWDTKMPLNFEIVIKNKGTKPLKLDLSDVFIHLKYTKHIPDKYASYDLELIPVSAKLGRKEVSKFAKLSLPTSSSLRLIYMTKEIQASFQKDNRGKIVMWENHPTGLYEMKVSLGIELNKECCYVYKSLMLELKN
jgi:hypothetical protein